MLSEHPLVAAAEVAGAQRQSLQELGGLEPLARFLLREHSISDGVSLRRHLVRIIRSEDRHLNFVESFNAIPLERGKLADPKVRKEWLCRLDN